MKKQKILTITGFLLITLLIGLVVAVQAHDFSIRTSYSNSYGTGIAIQEVVSGYWLSEEIPELYFNQSYEIKYYIDNLIQEEDEARVTVKLNNNVLRDYQTTINEFHYKTIPLSISYLECNSTNFISLEVQPVNGEDLNMYDNFAERSFRVSCEELPDSICGNGVVEFREECDVGDSLQGCNPGYGETCEYCSNECEFIEVKGSYCGDGIKDNIYEACDDGNNINGDGCSSSCTREGQNGGDLVTDIITEDFQPMVWQCGGRIVLDDSVEPGRISEQCSNNNQRAMDVSCKGDEILIERINNYAFEGEQIKWKVLVWDKNGIEKIKDVYGSLDGNIEVNCKLQENVILNDYAEMPSVNLREIDPSCNARILEEEIKQFDSETMAYYTCTLTVETPLSMYGEYQVTVQAEDLDGIIGSMDEKEFWFLNPEISLGINGEIVFDNLRQGTTGYSETIKITNEADIGSGVLLDMFISGTDFYDSSNSGAMCGTTNSLLLKNFKYYAVNGAYSTRDNGCKCDKEGYCPINYGIGFNDPNPFYNNNEILQVGPSIGPYYGANILAPGADLAMTFKLNLPEPCNGDFDSGQIYFWGEAI